MIEPTKIIPTVLVPAGWVQLLNGDLLEYGDMISIKENIFDGHGFLKTSCIDGRGRIAIDEPSGFILTSRAGHYVDSDFICFRRIQDETEQP